MAKFFLKYVFFLFVALLASSCIENDLSYPYAPGDITSLVLEGQKSVAIDNETRTVEVVMGESADMSSVKVVECSFSNNAQVVGGMPDYLDFTQPVVLVLRVYQDYEWTIRAVQPVERYIRCDNQVGEAMIDAVEKTAYVYVNKSQPLTSVRFNEVKLEPEGSVVKNTLGFVSVDGKSVPELLDCEFPMTLDCVIMRYFFVDYLGEEIRWSVKVLHKEVGLEVASVNPWACFAGVKGTSNGQGSPVLEYRKAADSEWIEYGDINLDGSTVTAELRGLEPSTDYVVRLSNGEAVSNEMAFTTEGTEQLGNFSFDDWFQDGKAWMPYMSGGAQVWDTANKGSSAVGYNPTIPESEIVVKGKAVKMETMQVNILGIKKLAAGNIYTGKFDKLAGLGAELDWGVPFGARPLALRGYYKYVPAVINVAEDKDYKDKLGQMDECQIQVFLAEWDKPFHVNSAKKLFVDRNDGSVIAFSELCSSENDSEYKRFTLPIVYNDNRIPTYIIVSGCASRYGNYFVGGAPSAENGNKGSLLYIDEFELVYDPAELTEEEYAAVFSKVKPF